MPANPVEHVHAALRALEIPFEHYSHPPVFTADEAAIHWASIPAMPVKNLFLRNKKGNRHYLVILGIDREADLRHLVQVIGDDRLSFASPERLVTHLGVEPGSVSPFGLLHEGSREVIVIVDAALRGAGRLIFHPNVNTASVTIATSDFERFLAERGNVVRWLQF